MQYGPTALMMAAGYGHVNVVQCLVGVGVNLEPVDLVSVHVVWEYVDV
jgi:hypothetical protein